MSGQSISEEFTTSRGLSDDETVSVQPDSVTSMNWGEMEDCTDTLPSSALDDGATATSLDESLPPRKAKVPQFLFGDDFFDDFLADEAPAAKGAVKDSGSDSIADNGTSVDIFCDILENLHGRSKGRRNKSSSPGSAKDAAAPSCTWRWRERCQAISRANFGSGSKT